SVFRSTKEDCSENIEVLKQVVERGKEATTSPEGLSYPKAMHRSERRWIRRSAAEADLPIDEERDTDARQWMVGHGLGNAMVPQRRDFRRVIRPLLLWRESVGRKKGPRRWRMQRQTPSNTTGRKGRGQRNS
ncbi:hypothetical protein BHM03_00049802, partial [Ensete ventricosum]